MRRNGCIHPLIMQAMGHGDRNLMAGGSDPLTQRFRAVYEARTGCTVACHCRPDTIGVMFLNK